MNGAGWPKSPARLAAGLLIFTMIGGSAAAQYRAEAIPGSPLGVGRIEIRLPEAEYSPVLGIDGLLVRERNGRVFYPAIQHREIPEIVTNTLKSSRRPLVQLFGEVLDQPPTAVVYFLFDGDEPLDLAIQSTRVEQVIVRPRPNPRGWSRLLKEWWQHFADRPGLLKQKDDYPPIVQNYLEATLARRLGLPLPAERPSLPWKRDFQEQVGVSLATEQVKIEFERRRILGNPALAEPADQALPAAIAAAPTPPPDVPGETVIEPLAMHVPAECLYVRFGNFNNFLWLQDTLKKWNGDARNLVSLRGLDYAMSARMEQGLVLQQTALSRLFGATVIQDVAIIGTDAYFADGAAYGLLFQASNNMLLGADFNRQRAERLKAESDVTESAVEIGGRKVSFLSSPDGRVRSFYVTSGDFHFVTRSRRLAERFLETAAAPETALGSGAGFRHARTLMPTARDDTVFVYMSEPFLDNLVSPAYRIETARRLEALADIELAALARLSARSAGHPCDSIEALKKHGHLPPEFGVRPDGSQAVVGEELVVDSLRGRRGAFLPIADVAVDRVTASEARAYAAFVDYYQRHWGNLDPIIVAVKRSAEGKNRERVVVDARMTPFSRANFTRLQEKLGPADTLQLEPVAGNFASFEAILADGRIFGGLQDVGSPIPEGILSLLPRNFFPQFLVGYLGSRGPLGPLRLLNLGFPPPDPAGFSKSRIGGWRLQAGEFTLFSFQREILAAVAPRLRFQEASEPAQIRLQVDDVSVASVMPALNNYLHGRTAETSRGNLRLMHALEQQLGVPLEECRETAEKLLDAKLVCPLGGQYALSQSPAGVGFWTSTALAESPPASVPGAETEAFLAPPLNWFRGLTARVHVMPDALSVHAEVVMQSPK